MEILVALVVLSIVSILAYRAFDGILRLEARSKTEFLRENRLSVATSVMLQDLLHMRPRPVRDQLGGQLGAYLAPSGEYALEFTRGGLPDFDYMRGGIQRVAYRIDDGRLVRTAWRVADRGPETAHQDQVLASGLSRMDVEQLGEADRFLPAWPPANQSVQLDGLPAMVRVTLTTREGEQVRIMAPGPDPAPVPVDPRRPLGGDVEG